MLSLPFPAPGSLARRLAASLIAGAEALAALQPQWLIGVGAFAERCARGVLAAGLVEPELAARVQVAQILHPSPASPAANRGWAEAVERTLAPLALLPPAADQIQRRVPAR